MVHNFMLVECLESIFVILDSILPRMPLVKSDFIFKHCQWSVLERIRFSRVIFSMHVLFIFFNEFNEIL